MTEGQTFCHAEVEDLNRRSQRPQRTELLFWLRVLCVLLFEILVKHDRGTGLLSWRSLRAFVRNSGVKDFMTEGQAFCELSCFKTGVEREEG